MLTCFNKFFRETLRHRFYFTNRFKTIFDRVVVVIWTVKSLGKGMRVFTTTKEEIEVELFEKILLSCTRKMIIFQKNFCDCDLSWMKMMMMADVSENVILTVKMAAAIKISWQRDKYKTSHENNNGNLRLVSFLQL